jgi:hypothetical protein
MQTLVATKILVEPEQAEKLRSLFLTPAYGTLREIICGRCAEAQVEFMNTSLYQNDNADQRALEARAKAIGYNLVLDVLDDIQSKEQEWFRIKLETG